MTVEEYQRLILVFNSMTYKEKSELIRSLKQDPKVQELDCLDVLVGGNRLRLLDARRDAFFEGVKKYEDSRVD